MTEDVARRSIDWLHYRGCRVLARMGGEPLLRPQMTRKMIYCAARKGFWVYSGTNGRLLRPEVVDRLADAGTAVFNFALDAWDEKPGLPNALAPVRRNLEYLIGKQFAYGYMAFFNMNIGRNSLEDIRLLTDYAREQRLADYHLNETLMLKQDDHFKHLRDNPTYILHCGSKPGTALREASTVSQISTAELPARRMNRSKKPRHRATFFQLLKCR